MSYKGSVADSEFGLNSERGMGPVFVSDRDSREAEQSSEQSREPNVFRLNSGEKKSHSIVVVVVV